MKYAGRDGAIRRRVSGFITESSQRCLGNNDTSPNQASDDDEPSSMSSEIRWSAMAMQTMKYQFGPRR